MQVNTINSNHNTPNFQAIRSVKCRGLYEKYPELAQQLVDTFKKSSEAMEFCKKYDTDIVFYARKDGMDAVESSIHILYDNPALSKFKKFLKFMSSSKDNVTISAFGNEYNLPESLKSATDSLKEYMLPWSKSTNPRGGILASHIESTDMDIQEALVKRTEKIETKKAKVESDKKIKTDLDNNRAKLDSSIQDLIEEGQ